MPLYNDNPDGDWTAAHLALFHRFADYLADSDRYDKPPLASPPQYNDWVYEIRECHRGVKGLPSFSDDYSGPIPRKVPVSVHAPEVVSNDTFAELYIRSQLANQEKQAEIQNMGFEALHQENRSRDVPMGPMYITATFCYGVLWSAMPYCQATSGFPDVIRQGIAAGQRKSGFHPKTRGFFNKFRGRAHVDSYVPDYDNRNGKRERTRSRDGRDVRARRDSRSADRSADRSDARDRSPTRGRSRSPTRGRSRSPTRGRSRSRTSALPAYRRPTSRETDAVAARSLERLSKRVEEEKRAYDATDVTMKDVEHTGTVAKASSSKQPASSANLVEMIASLNITAPRPSSTFSFKPQTSGSAAVTTSVLGGNSAEKKGKDKETNPTMVPLPESDDDGENDAMRGK
ncbi:hypothetical protein DFH08DRAFT_825680 [Mycena albidolilacea]|uniref:Uncharacterized protein n=1 Tax=Mycena albidolilacea TaxID=1033008 RepID=A0AAD7E9R9_9AGAR|nr:hypothetical protein DFH08DRAFT_825680 [Mycena albidolilacea]